VSRSDDDRLLVSRGYADVTTARIASAARASGRERGTCPSASRRKTTIDFALDEILPRHIR
jgi:hypothetical protein